MSGESSTDPSRESSGDAEEASSRGVEEGLAPKGVRHGTGPNGKSYEIRDGHGNYLSRLSWRRYSRVIARQWSTSPADALIWHLRRDAEAALEKEFAAWEIGHDAIAVEEVDAEAEGAS